MDILQFTAALVDALAWPVVAFALVFFMRPYFGQILRLIRAVKYKDFEATFGEDVTQATSQKLERFWMPDGRRPDAVNEARLKDWMEKNGLSSVSITVLLNAGPLEMARRRAAVYLGLDQASDGDQSGGEG